jgi:hypothetical protein
VTGVQTCALPISPKPQNPLYLKIKLLFVNLKDLSILLNKNMKVLYMASLALVVLYTTLSKAI